MVSSWLFNTGSEIHDTMTNLPPGFWSRPQVQFGNYLAGKVSELRLFLKVQKER